MGSAVIQYHGTPITPATAAVRALAGGHAFVSWACQDQLGLVVEVASSFALDNGAFSAWRSGHPVDDWAPYYRWVDDCRRLPGFDWAVIPDVIDGDESANDALLDEWPLPIWMGVPVWHLHESLDRLGRLVETYPRIAFGSSGAWPTPGVAKWWDRMGEALAVACDGEGRPRTKLHGLRMLDPAIYTRIPFSSADSTNIAQNIGIDGAWKGTYRPISKDARAAVMRERIEAFQSPPVWVEPPTQFSLFECVQ